MDVIHGKLFGWLILKEQEQAARAKNASPSVDDQIAALRAREDIEPEERNQKLVELYKLKAPGKLKTY
jgi:hypothetical protein